MKERCDCLACFGFRLAAAMFLIGLAVIILLGALLQAATPKPLLISDDSSSGGAAQSRDAKLENRSAAPVTRADYSLCVRVNPGPLEKRRRRDTRPNRPSELA